MKNRYEIRGDTTVIFIERRNGDKYEVLIDTEDIDRVSHIKWGVLVLGCGKVYVQGRTPKAEGGKLIYLHRLITNASKGEVVDHQNGNTLDNRKANLLVTNQTGNLQNVSKARKDSRTGVRGVYYYEKKSYYVAYGRLNKRRITIGYFKDIEEARRAREKWEKENHPNSPLNH